jgi:Glycosyltransferase 61
LFALFYDQTLRDPVIVFDLDRRRVLHGPAREIRPLGSGEFAIDGARYSWKPTPRPGTFECQPRNRAAPSYLVFLADRCVTRMRGTAELPHVESETEAAAARENRHDFFFVLQRPELMNGFSRSRYYNASPLFDEDAYRASLSGFAEVFGLAFLHSAVTHAPNLVQASDGCFLREPLSPSQWTTKAVGSAMFSRALGWIFYAEPRDAPRRHIAGYNLVLSPLNYAHWHVQNLPALYGMAELIRRGILRESEVNIVVSEHSLAELLHFYLDLLDIRPTVIDPFRENIPSFTGDCTLLPISADTPGAYRWSPYLAQALSIMSQPAEHRDKILFIGRDDADNRRGLINENEVLAALRSAGLPVTRIVAGQLSHAEQRRRFAEARMVIGTHGGGLTNALYSDKRCAVLEIISDTHNPNRAWYERLFHLLEHPYAAVNCPAAGPDWEAAYYADPELVVSAAEALKKKRSQP